jgi:hypothetical protein
MAIVRWKRESSSCSHVCRSAEYEAIQEIMHCYM